MTSNEFVIDGEQVNKLLEAYQLRHEMLPGQVFDIVEKRFVKSLADEIDKARPQTVRFVNTDAIATGPHKDFMYAICGGLAELIDSLASRGVAVSGTALDLHILPWNFLSRINKDFKGSAGPTPPSAS